MSISRGMSSRLSSFFILLTHAPVRVIEISPNQSRLNKATPFSILSPHSRYSSSFCSFQYFLSMDTSLLYPSPSQVCCFSFSVPRSNRIFFSPLFYDVVLCRCNSQFSPYNSNATYNHVPLNFARPFFLIEVLTVDLVGAQKWSKRRDTGT